MNGPTPADAKDWMSPAERLDYEILVLANKGHLLLIDRKSVV